MKATNEMTIDELLRRFAYTFADQRGSACFSELRERFAKADELTTLRAKLVEWRDEEPVVHSNDPMRIEMNRGVSIKQYWLQRILDLIDGKEDGS